LSSGFNPGKMIEDLEQALKRAGMPEEEAKHKAAQQVNSMGATKIATGSCPLGGANPMACMFCAYGHMTECHYPLTCEEAKCSHYQQELEAGGMKTDTERQLWGIECCSGTGHTIKEGGSHINFVVLNKKAFSKYMVAYDFWLNGKERPLRAMAVLCDRCWHEGREAIWALAKDGDDKPIYRIPVAELGNWSYEQGGG